MTASLEVKRETLGNYEAKCFVREERKQTDILVEFEQCYLGEDAFVRLWLKNLRRQYKSTPQVES